MQTEKTGRENGAGLKQTAATAVVARVRDAINKHDLDELASCFDPNYQSDFPVHPDRAFRGRAQMRENWSQIFGAVPNIEAALLNCTSQGNVAWLSGNGGVSGLMARSTSCGA